MANDTAKKKNKTLSKKDLGFALVNLVREAVAAGMAQREFETMLRDIWIFSQTTIAAADECYSLARADLLHRQVATIFEQLGLRRQAAGERAKSFAIGRAIGAWTMDRVAAYKEDKSTQIENMRQMMVEHHMVDKSIAASLAENVVRSNRDLAALASQKGWLGGSDDPKIDGATLAIGCEKLRRLGIRPGYERFVERLDQLANDIGVDKDVFEAAKDFMDEQELEEEWQRQRQRA